MSIAGSSQRSGYWQSSLKMSRGDAAYEGVGGMVEISWSFSRKEMLFANDDYRTIQTYSMIRPMGGDRRICKPNTTRSHGGCSTQSAPRSNAYRQASSSPDVAVGKTPWQRAAGGDGVAQTQHAVAESPRQRVLEGVGHASRHNRKLQFRPSRAEELAEANP
jgi:hypothetical protein